MTRYSEKTGLAQAYQVGPFDSTHLYVQWGGKLPGDEEWSCGFRMWAAGGADPADAVADLTIISDAIAAYHARATSHISSKVKLSFVKVNAIDVNGHYQGAGTTERLFADISGGGTGAGNNPNQIALAVSLTTGFSRGPAHRGRFFNPCPDVGVDTDGTISAGQALEVATSAKALMTAVNVGGPATHQMVVMSRKAGAPGHRAVTGMQVGRILDTQRRRRNSLAENYSTAP
jgi:hypothetical protein